LLVIFYYLLIVVTFTEAILRTFFNVMVTFKAELGSAIVTRSVLPVPTHIAGAVVLHNKPLTQSWWIVMIHSDTTEITHSIHQ